MQMLALAGHERSNALRSLRVSGAVCECRACERVDAPRLSVRLELGHDLGRCEEITGPYACEGPELGQAAYDHDACKRALREALVIVSEIHERFVDDNESL